MADGISKWEEWNNYKVYFGLSRDPPWEYQRMVIALS